MLCEYILKGKRGPGKFEGEWCGTLLAHSLVLDGLSETCQHHPDCEFISGPISKQDIADYNDAARPSGPICPTCAASLLEGGSIHYWESDGGFAFSDQEGGSSRLAKITVGEKRTKKESCV